jgi:purine nucleoside phosphorylase
MLRPGHSSTHSIPPSSVPARANIAALKVSFTVGSGCMVGYFEWIAGGQVALDSWPSTSGRARSVGKSADKLTSLQHIGIKAIVAFSAVGSLREEVRPCVLFKIAFVRTLTCAPVLSGDLIVPDQIIDRTKVRTVAVFT